MTEQRTGPVSTLDTDVPVQRWATAEQAMTCRCGEQIRPGDHVAVLLDEATVCEECVEFD